MNGFSFGTQKIQLTYNPLDEFRILVISDVQQQNTVIPEAVESIEKLIDKTAPSLIVLLGDNGWGMNDVNIYRSYLTQLTKPFEDRHIPWCHVFGNHDSEELPEFGLFSLKRPEVMELYKEFPYCITKDSEEGVYGIGNCVLPVYDGSEPSFLVWLLDSNDRMDEIRPNIWQAARMPDCRIDPTASYFSFIRHSQIHWYYETSEKIEKAFGRKIPGQMFFHIPLPEFAMIMDHPEETKRTGAADLTDFCPSTINSGLFSAIIERDDVKGLFFGHDHPNTCDGEYCGIKMGYCGCMYPCKYDFPSNGARLITVSKANPGIVNTEYLYVHDL